MRTVGPSTNTNSARITASTMLMLDSQWMPRATPDTAEPTNANVSSPTRATSANVPTLSIQPMISRPEPICSAPSPSDAAVPNIVAMIARMSMTFPTAPSERRPRRGKNAALMSCLRPRR